MSARTLEDLRIDVIARLGYAAGSPSAMITNVNSILSQAQVALYNTHDWARLRKYEDKPIGLDQYLIDYPTLANPDRIKAISIWDGYTWSKPLVKGIRPELYTYQSQNSKPQRWEPYDQIELFPKADQAYTARIFYVKALTRFTQNADYTTVDGDLVFAVALGWAKAHYKQADAQVHLQEATNLLARMKAKSWGQDVFRPDEYEPLEVLARPVVV